MVFEAEKCKIEDMSSMYLSKFSSKRQLMSPMQEKYFSLGRDLKSLSPNSRRPISFRTEINGVNSQIRSPSRKSEKGDKTVGFVIE